MVDNGILWINPYPVDNTIFIDFPNTQPVDIEDITWPPTNELPNHFALIVFWCERRDVLCSHSNGDIFTCEDNMLFSHCGDIKFSRESSLGISLVFKYIINRTLHGRLEIGKFSSHVEKILHSFAALTLEIFFNTQREISYLRAAM